MITVYTTDNCPKCKILKQKLNEKEISYEECKDVDKMVALDIQEVPMLDINAGALLTFGEAVKWVNNN